MQLQSFIECLDDMHELLLTASSYKPISAGTGICLAKNIPNCPRTKITSNEIDLSPQTTKFSSNELLPFYSNTVITYYLYRQVRAVNRQVGNQLMGNSCEVPWHQEDGVTPSPGHLTTVVCQVPGTNQRTGTGWAGRYKFKVGIF